MTQAPALCLWLVLAGVVSLRSGDRDQRRVGLLMLALAAANGLLVAAYFVGLRLPAEPKDLAMLSKTAAKFVTLSAGPAARSLWPYSGALVLGSLLLTAAILVRVLRDAPTQRLRVAAILAYFAALSCMALAVGFKTESWSVGFSARYITLPTPFLCAAYLTWSRYAPRRLGSCLRAGWCLFLGATLPYYVALGLTHGEMQSRALEQLAVDARAGATSEELAERHWEGLLPDKERFRRQLELLRRAGFAPFADAR